MGFRAPILGVQADPGSKPLGWVLGVREVDDELYPLLSRPQTPEKTDETVLVRRQEGGIEFISPLVYESPLRLSLVKPEPEVRDGFMDLPEGVGLGIELDPDTVERYRADA